MTNLTLLLTFIVGIFIFLGSLSVLFIKNDTRFVSFSIGMATSVLITLALFDILDEVLKHTDNLSLILISLITGFLSLKILDYFIPDHETNDQGHMLHIGTIETIALVLHNIIEGMAVCGIAVTSLKAGLLLGLGICFHNIPLGISIASTYKSAGKSNKYTLITTFLISISTFLGGVLMLIFKTQLLNNILFAILLSVTLGMILYIILMELVPYMITTKEKKTTYQGFIFGLIIFLVSKLF